MTQLPAGTRDPLRVLCLTTLPTLGAGNRLRIEQYTPLLRRDGIELEVSAFFDDSTYRWLYEPGHTFHKGVGVARGLLRRLRDALRSRRYDLVIVYRESAPLGPPIFERWLDRLGIPYVFDFDDAIFLGAIHPANRGWAWMRRPSRVPESVARARAVIAGNEYLATWARQHSNDVTVIPTPVDTDRFRPRPHGNSDSPLVLGWVGSSTTAPYLRLIDGPLEALARHRHIVVRVIGGDYDLPSVAVERRPYSLENEPEDVAAFDIGLLPEPDDAWTRGKGAFKALLYMASEVPVLASRVGVNVDVIGDGVAGMCVDGDIEWSRALERLADDPELRRALGRAGRQRVEREHSLRVRAPAFAAVLRRAGGSAA